MVRETQNPPFAIDARMLDREGTGVATYAHALDDALHALGHAPLRLSDPSCGGPMLPARPIERWVRWSDALVDRRRRLRRRGDNLWARDIFRVAQGHFDRHGRLLRLRAPGRPGIIHWTYPLPIMIEGWSNIYTVHDAIPLTAPELTRIDSWRHRQLLTCLADSAAHLLTVSEAARREIVAALGCRADLVSACPTGLSLDQPAGELPEGLVPGGYLLFVGSVEPRKNLTRLTQAFARSGVDMPLVIAGPDGWRGEEIAPLLRATPHVLRLPYVTRPTLIALIAGARALLFPTLAEGFGLPIIEAMKLGVPVMTSRGGATEEIAGGAARLVDPLSIGDMARQIESLASDDAAVAKLARAGALRAETYTAQAFAERLDAVHRRLLDR